MPFAKFEGEHNNFEITPYACAHLVRISQESLKLSRMFLATNSYQIIGKIFKFSKFPGWFDEHALLFTSCKSTPVLKREKSTVEQVEVGIENPGKSQIFNHMLLTRLHFLENHQNRCLISAFCSDSFLDWFELWKNGTSSKIFRSKHAWTKAEYCVWLVVQASWSFVLLLGSFHPLVMLHPWKATGKRNGHPHLALLSAGNALHKPALPLWALLNLALLPAPKSLTNRNSHHFLRIVMVVCYCNCLDESGDFPGNTYPKTEFRSRILFSSSRLPSNTRSSKTSEPRMMSMLPGSSKLGSAKWTDFNILQVTVGILPEDNISVSIGIIRNLTFMKLLSLIWICRSTVAVCKGFEPWIPVTVTWQCCLWSPSFAA